MESSSAAFSSSLLFDDLQLSSSSSSSSSDNEEVCVGDGRKKRRRREKTGDRPQSSSSEDESDYDPDSDALPGSWGLIMGRRENHKEVKKDAPSLDDCVVPERILAVFATLLEKDKFQFSHSVAFLRMVRKQVDQAMHSAFSTMLSSSGIRVCQLPLHDSEEEEKRIAAARISVAKALSNIAASSNPGNSFRPIASMFNKLSEFHHSRVCSKMLFYREIHAVISLYLSLVYIQRAMNNDNTNSSGYAEDMVSKMLSIIGKIPREEMSREKYISVGRDALYLYQNVITDVTGPKFSKRLRTPQQQADFCYVIAMLVNDVPIVSDLTLAKKATTLVQFASAMRDPAYRLAVQKTACVFNSTYSVYKVLGLERDSLICADQILAVLSAARIKSLGERKPRTFAQSAFLFLRPSLKDKLRTSGLTSEDNSLGTVAKSVSQQLRFEGIDIQTLEDGRRILSGSYDSTEGVTLKCLGAGIKDMKVVGLSTLMTARTRKRVRRNVPFY